MPKVLWRGFSNEQEGVQEALRLALSFVRFLSNLALIFVLGVLVVDSGLYAYVVCFLRGPA